MNEIKTKEELFLVKLKCLLNKFDELDDMFDEIDEIIENQPDNQSKIDQLLSDYYHRLEHDDLSDGEIINIGKKIHDVRLIRNDENSVAKLIFCYNQNKNKLSYSCRQNREMFYHAMSTVKKTLHEDYKYRILTDDDIKQLSNITKEKKIDNYHKGITKDKLKKCLSKGMKTKEIAQYFGTHDSYISTLKRKFGFAKKG